MHDDIGHYMQAVSDLKARLAHVLNIVNDMQRTMWDQNGDKSHIPPEVIVTWCNILRKAIAGETDPQFTDAEMDVILRSAGYDPEKLNERGKGLAARLISLSYRDDDAAGEPPGIDSDDRRHAALSQDPEY